VGDSLPALPQVDLGGRQLLRLVRRPAAKGSERRAMITIGLLLLIIAIILAVISFVVEDRRIVAGAVLALAFAVALQSVKF
jgi:hypothetical protein